MQVYSAVNQNPASGLDLMQVCLNLAIALGVELAVIFQSHTSPARMTLSRFHVAANLG